MTHVGDLHTTLTGSSAIFSPDRTWRYTLERRWSAGPRMMVIGLNPSTADEIQDDPTIRRCIGFAKREGCGALLMTNLFGLRSTDPRALRTHPDPVGPDNDLWLEVAAERSDLIACAWGIHGAYLGRADEVLELLRDHHLLCLGITKEGHPRHPLYLAASTPLEWYAGAGPEEVEVA